MSSAAFAIGQTAVPTPITEADWPGWLYHQFGDCRVVTATIADGVNASGANFRMEIDSKAMRKQGADETLMAVLEVSEQGTATMEMHGDLRILDKLV